jgi:hypothetical protein
MIAAEARRLIDDEAWSPDQVAEWIVGHMSEVGPAVIHDVFVLMADESREQAERSRAHVEQMDRLRTLFDGLPRDIKLREAAKIKAAAGDPLAKQMLAHFSSREYRVFDALLDAAIERHPEYEQAGRGFRHISGQPMPDKIEQTLVDWFQMHYPREARAIEDAVQPTGDEP